jgi:hypothetical protein
MAEPIKWRLLILLIFDFRLWNIVDRSMGHSNGTWNLLICGPFQCGVRSAECGVRMAIADFRFSIVDRSMGHSNGTWEPSYLRAVPVRSAECGVRSANGDC